MPQFLPTIQDRDFNNFKDRLDGTTARYVTDETAQNILNAILAALGGVVSVTPTVQNISVPLADVEVSFALPLNCKGFVLRSRKSARIKFGYATGVSTLYFTIPVGGWFEDTKTFASQTIYFSSSVASNTIELITYG